MRASTFVRRLVGSVVASAVCGALLATVPSVATAQAATAPLPWLTTSGNHIVSADTGQEVLLRGANIGRSEWDMRMDTERRAIPALAGTWKGNMILRGFASDAVLGNDATYLGLLDEYVALAAANRMYVMFAWRSHEINGQQPTMPDDRAQEALARLATRYHGVPHVMYALQVEPHDVTWSQLHPRYTSMVAAVRRAAAPHEPIIMVPGTHWSRDVSGALTQPIPGADIVYKTHPYNTVDDFQRHFGSVVDAGLPVFIGEFGYLPEHGMHMADIDALMRYANTKRLGWAAWAFDVDGNPGLVSDNTTFDPSWPYGHAVKNQMVNTPPVPTATPTPPPPPTPPTPPGTTVTTVNDSTVGTGVGAFVYAAGWETSTGSTTKSGGDDHYSEVSGTVATLRFSGTGVTLVGSRAPWHGRAAVSIDGGPERVVDYYSATRRDQVRVFTSPVLARGEHVLKVRVLGTRSATSTGDVVTIDRADVSS